MTALRSLLVVAALAATPALAAPPASAKAKRLAPADPPPAAIAVPEEPKAPIAGSCAMKSACAEYQGAFTGVDTQALCAKANGTWSKAACATEGSIGACTQRQDGTEDRIVTRSYAPTKADDARKACVNLPRGIFLKSN